jgi:hypothetical protein
VLQTKEIARLNAVDVQETPQFSSEERFTEPRDILALCSSMVPTTVEAADSSHGEKVEKQVRVVHVSVNEHLVSEQVQNRVSRGILLRDIHAL